MGWRKVSWGLLGVWFCLGFCDHYYPSSIPIQTPSAVPLKKGEKAFVPLSTLIPGQSRYSLLRVDAKEREYEARGRIKSLEDEWTLRYAHGQSVLPANRAIPVIQTSFGFVAVDGHHSILLSIHVGATHIPIEVIRDKSQLSPEDFWKKAKQKKWVRYDHDTHPLRAGVDSFLEMTDDPNRYLIYLITRKFTGNKFRLSHSKGASTPLILRSKSAPPFVDLDLARLLSENEIHYKEKWGDTIPPKKLEEIAALFTRLKGELNYPGMIFLENPTELSDLVEVVGKVVP